MSKPPTKKAFRYRLEQMIRKTFMRAIIIVASGRQTVAMDPRGQELKRILLVRANFRIGNAILTLPAIAAFRKKYPDAKIDYVGSQMSRVLFQNQPLDHHFVTPRRFPQVLWQFAGLIRRLRANRYDLAIDVSCSQSSLASFIIGLSGARIRAGCSGKWDGLYNFRVAELAETNKYRKLTEFLTALRLDSIGEVGMLKFSAAELAAGRAALTGAVGEVSGPVVGVFIGGRKLRGKRWPLENFVEVVAGLNRNGFRVVTFLGPEEADIADEIKAALGPGAILLSEPSLRKFAVLVSQLKLFICCDSGPMHLTCAVGVRVVAIFRERDLARWSPPASVARTVSSAGTVSAEAVLNAALEELSKNSLVSSGQLPRI